MSLVKKKVTNLSGYKKKNMEEKKIALYFTVKNAQIKPGNIGLTTISLWNKPKDFNIIKIRFNKKKLFSF